MMNVSRRLSLLATLLGLTAASVSAQVICPAPQVTMLGTACGASTIGITGVPSQGQTFSVDLSNLPAPGTPYFCLYSPGLMTTPLGPAWGAGCFLWIDPATMVVLSSPGAVVPVGATTLSQPITLPPNFPCSTLMNFQYLTTGDYRSTRALVVVSG